MFHSTIYLFKDVIHVICNICTIQYMFKDVIYVTCKGVGGWCRRLIFRSSGGPGEPRKDESGFLILTTREVDT